MSTPISSECSKCHPDPLHCPTCHGVGFVETSQIECPKCKGQPRGCYQCMAGYIQLDWTECDRCFLFEGN